MAQLLARFVDLCWFVMQSFGCPGRCESGAPRGLGQPVDDRKTEGSRASAPAARLHPRARPRRWRGKGRRPRPRARSLGHDDPSRPRDPPRPRTAREGPRRRGGGPRLVSVRAWVHREIVDAAGREGGHRRGGRRLRRTRNGHRHLSGHHHLCACAAAGRRGRTDRGHELDACRRHPARSRPPGPDDHPHRRGPHPVGCAGRTVRRVRAAQREPRPRLHGRPRDGWPLGLHVTESPGG